MADVKFSELDALTTLASADLFAVTDDSEAVAEKSKKVTYGNLLLNLAQSILPNKWKHNLVVKTASTSTVDINADELVVTDGTNKTLLESVDLTVNIVASGANGLDTGAEASSTMYYLWVIYNPTTATTSGLISASGSSPTLPSGYTYYRLVGEVYNGSSSNFALCRRDGDEVWFEVDQAVYYSTTLTTSFVGKTVPASVPASATFLHLEASSSAQGSANLQVVYAQASNTFGTSTHQSYSGGGGQDNNSSYHTVHFVLPYDGSGALYAKANLSSSQGNQNLYVRGYVCPR